MYLEIFLADFAVFRVFWGISRDFAEIPEIRGSATARNIRSPVNVFCRDCFSCTATKVLWLSCFRNSFLKFLFWITMNIQANNCLFNVGMLMYLKSHENSTVNQFFIFYFRYGLIIWWKKRKWIEISKGDNWGSISH